MRKRRSADPMVRLLREADRDLAKDLTIRPHSALDYKSPKQFSDKGDRGLHGQPPKDEKGVSDR